MIEPRPGQENRRSNRAAQRRDSALGIRRYRVRRVAAGALARQGAIAGLLVGLAPGALAGALLAVLFRMAHQTVETWRTVRLPLPLGASATVNFVDLLRLNGLLDVLRSWDSPLLTVLVVTVAAMLVGALAGAAIGFLGGALYNAGAHAGGGVVIELDPLGEDPEDGE